MAIHDNPRIVTNGLVLNLDAANVRSYPRSGTTWTDISGQGNSGTLSGGPTFDANNSGSIVFDGTNDQVLVSSNASIPYAASARTVNIWFYTNSSSWITNVNNLFFYGDGVTGQAFGIDMDTYPKMEVFTWGGSGRDFVFDTTYLEVGWKNICVTYDGSTTIRVYENGGLTQTFTLTAACNTPSSDVYIGARRPTPTAVYYDGRIQQTSIYNRDLSAAEIRQNFNALRGRFGI